MGKRTPESYLAHKEKQVRKYRLRRRQAVDALGGVCALCGWDVVDDLDIDHTDRTSKLIRPSDFHNVSKERFELEVSKCQLLCHNPCHITKTIAERRGEHWTVTIALAEINAEANRFTDEEMGEMEDLF